MLLTEQNFDTPSATISVLRKSLHGGFIPVEELSSKEENICERADWIEKCIKFRCGNCGDRHKTAIDDIHCVRRAQSTTATDEESGFRKKPGIELEIQTETDYNIFIREHSTVVDVNETPYKTLIVVPNIDELTFTDRAGSRVFIPIQRIHELFSSLSDNDLISEIQERRKRLLDWEALDDQGNEFQEIIYYLIERDDDYFNCDWGGSGQDQGKDSFCSIDLGGRPTRILVQAKFNNRGSAVNDIQVERYCRKASERQDCNGLIVAAVKTSGDLETEFDKGAFHSRQVRYLEIWSGPKIKERLSQHPDLIGEYFLT